MIRGAFAAALTPLRDGGAALDEEAFGAYVGFLATAASTGSSPSAPRARECSSASASAGGPRSSSSRLRAAALDVAVHCGAQSTADTVALAAHAAEAGAAAVAVIAPPYFPLDGRARSSALHRGRRGVLARAVLHLRVRGAQRLRGTDRGDRAAARARSRTSRDSRSPTSRGRSSSHICSRARRLRRGRGPRRPRARRRRGGRRLRARRRLPGGGCGARARAVAGAHRRGGAAARRRSTASRSRAPARPSSAGVESRSGPTCVRRSARSPRTS